MTTDKKLLKKVLTLELDIDGATEELFLYEDLIVGEDIDEDLDKSHIMFTFYSVLGQEFIDKAEILSIQLEKWEGDKWRKLKSSKKKKYTDNDARRKIESSAHRMRTKIQISKYKKLGNQLIYGAGKGIWMKGLNLNARIKNRDRQLSDFNVRDSEEVRNSFKSKLKNRR